ncbi:signal peptidase I [Candidatus Woesearchaeota archaeon]|nr:signal peptidase I [Candidatus Woesearchaeota archaeon]
MKRQGKQDRQDKRKPGVKQLLKRFWHFIWEEDSVWSWLANIAIAFVLIKFIVYPGLSLVLGTTHPIVAVVSGSMEHPDDFDAWWEQHEQFYQSFGIAKEEFRGYRFPHGFNKGDIMVLRGIEPKDIKKGDVIVFNGGKSDPIIHRVVNSWEENNVYYFQTKGDNNPRSLPGIETRIKEDLVIGKASVRIPLLGYIKLLFVEFLQLIGVS